MNREIKFRVWTGIGMEYNVIAGAFGHFYINPGDKKDGLDPKDSASLTSFNTKYSKETPLMEFTGLKDKNGKEIYEGDIVEICVSAPWDEQVPIDIQGEVMFENGGWYFRGIKSNHEDCYLVEYENLKIIGNIHENPELLEK